MDSGLDNGELVAAKPRHRVGLPDRGGEPLGDGDEQCVARLVAKLIIDRLEAVDVEIVDRDTPARLASASAVPSRSANSARFGRLVSVS